MVKKVLLTVLSAVFAVTSTPVAGYASVEYPKSSSKIKYFYVFGQNADPYVGAEDHTISIVIDVPAAEPNDLSIEVYDPDTTDKHDYKHRYDNPWDTETEFTVTGSGVLAEKTFGAGDDSYDGRKFEFGPFSKSSGKKVGNFYRFVLTANGKSGDDGNLFNIRVSPKSANVYSENLTFRLRSGKGDKMYFYPEVPAGTTKITIRNYDLDADGGSSVLYDDYNGSKYDVNDSLSSEWSDTTISLQDGPTRRLKYVVTKKNQRYAHAGLQVLDGSGNNLPIYFRKSAAPVAPKKKPKPAPAPAPSNACNTFTFDARSSFDKDKDKITYEWDFGDGTTSTEPVVRHTYATGGRYNVTLTVSDHSGLKCETETTTSYVDVNTPPTASFTAPDMVCAGEEVKVDAGASSDDNSSTLDYKWSFGDGTYGEGEVARKTYQKGGVYKINLNVDDGAGSSCSQDGTTQVVRVNTPPVANAGDDISLCVGNPNQDFNIKLSGSGNDADGDSLNYRWDLGDGASAQGRTVEHTYTKSGNYTARLTVSDDSGSQCSIDSDTVNITLNKSPVAIAGKDRYACAGTTIKFDGSESQADEGKSLDYTWDFGDGTTAQGRNVEHKFSKGGDYRVTLTVDDGSGSKCSVSMDQTHVHINSGPQALLRGSESLCSGESARFDASGSSDPDGDSLDYFWDFGDGTTKQGGSRVEHRYSKGGNYKVTVRVDDGSGAPCSASSDSIFVNVNTPPVADAGPNLVCCEEDLNRFDASGSSDADGDKLTYRWDFGDGNGGEGAQVSHTYTERGQYRVSVTVDDGTGTRCSTDSSSFVANVNAKPVPVIKVTQN